MFYIKSWSILLLIHENACIIHGNSWSDALTKTLTKAVEHSQDWLESSGVKHSLDETIDYIGFHSGLGEQCEFNPNPAQKVKEALAANLRAQERAVDAIVASIESWEFTHLQPTLTRGTSERSSSSSTRQSLKNPLVIAITGPTGCGKTETTNIIAEALFKRQKKQSSHKSTPTGLLVFRGEDFNDHVNEPISRYSQEIKSRLAQHLIMCSGKAVVVFDEVQKVIPQTLDVLMEPLSSGHGMLTYFKDGITRSIDCSHVIFILISDIGTERMQKMLLAHERREDVPHSALVSSVKDALDAQWARLQFGKLVDEVIPFLPLEPVHVAEIMALKLSDMNAEYRGKFWQQLVVRDGVVEALSRTKYIKYVQHQAMIQGHERRRVYAKYGARNVVNSGPLQRLKTIFYRHLRPWNARAQIVLSVVEDHDDRTSSSASSSLSSSELRVEACNFPTSTSGAQDDGETFFVQIQCETKWQGTL